MNVRKNRAHQTGLSNLSIKATLNELPSFSASARSPFHNELKAKRLADITLRRTSPEESPTKTAEHFYKSARKAKKDHALVAYPRTAQLEEIDKRKLAFTGESELVYDRKLEKYREGEKIEPLSTTLPPRKLDLVKEKHELHSNAIQETQLVGYDKYSADTLKNNVNLEKVREARRILRRRYANRNNLGRIYAAWDDDCTGSISHANVFNMSKKLGLNLNVDEARVLLASANKTGTGQLTLDEFLDLIYNKDDMLNVDLEHLSKNLDENYLVQRDELYTGDDNVIKKLELDAKKTRENRHMNQVSLVLRNKYNLVVHALLAQDPIRTGYMNYEKFNDCIKRLGINEHIVSQDDIRMLFNKYIMEDQHTTNYRAFLEHLRDFRFNHEDMYREPDSAKKQAIQRNMTMLPGEGLDDEELTIIDCKTAPVNVVMEYIARTENVNTSIKRYFPTKTEMKDYVANALKVEKEGLENQPMSKKELQDLVTGIFKHFDNSIVKKKDFEGFLSSFLYSEHGFTNVNELLETVYDSNEKTFFRKLARLKPSHPPPAHISGVNEDLIGGSEVMGETVVSQFKTQRSNSQVDIEKKGEAGSKEADKALQGILSKLDNHLFVNRKTQYDLFRTFDADKDGFVSHKELVKKIDELSLIPRSEIPKLIEYVDPENKGYVNFKDFHRRIRSNMANENSLGQLRTPSNAYPSKEWNSLVTPNVKKFRLKIDNIVKQNHPFYHNELKYSSIYTASPNWSNTFQNIQASTLSPLFVSEQQRFDKQHEHRTMYQREEKAKKTLTETSKLNLIKSHREAEATRIDNFDKMMTTAFACNMKSKAKEKDDYEQRAKIRNKYAY